MAPSSDRRRAAEPALEHDRPRHDRGAPGMPPRRLDDAHRVAAERRRQHLTRRVRDEVRAREPAAAARGCRARRGASPSAAASTGTVTTMIRAPTARTRRGPRPRGRRASSRGRSSRRDTRPLRRSGRASRRSANGRLTGCAPRGRRGSAARTPRSRPPPRSAARRRRTARSPPRRRTRRTTARVTRGRSRAPHAC